MVTYLGFTEKRESAVIKTQIKNILIVLLLTITAFSVFKYIWSLKEKYDLLNTLNQAKEQVATLETQRQNLLQDLKKEKELRQQLIQENSGIKEHLRASKKRLTELFAEYEGIQKKMEHLNSQVALLKAENTALIEKENKLAQLSQENDSLKARLSSIPELKKAIKELKGQMHKAGKEIKQGIKPGKIIEGNRGFLIKDGKFTYPATLKIEVIPVPQKNNE